MLKALCGIQQQYDNFSKINRAAGIGDRQLLQLFGHIAFLAHAGGVDQADFAGPIVEWLVGFVGAFFGRRLFGGARIGPLPINRNGIAGDASLWPRQQAVLAQQAVDEGRFASVWPANNGELQRALRRVLVILAGEFFGGHCGLCLRSDQREERAKQISDPVAMFCRDRHRLAHAK